jgi:lipopolysaccharide transport protein LptA
LNGTDTNAHTSTAAHPVTIRADFLEYLDEGRRARYHGNVHLVTESTTVTSDRLDVYLTQGNTVEGSQVDHAVADGHVKVTQPDRLGTGEHADYIAAPGKIILTGGPPILVDDEKGSTTGQRLTFFTHDDRLFVDGGDQKPSLSTHRVAP